MSEPIARADVFMHSNGYSTERNIAMAIMQKLGLDYTDFRRRDELIAAGAPWLDVERNERQAALTQQVAELTVELSETRDQLQTVHAHVKEALELLGVDVSVDGYIPDSWTLREQCHLAGNELAMFREKLGEFSQKQYEAANPKEQP